MCKFIDQVLESNTINVDGITYSDFYRYEFDDPDNVEGSLFLSVAGYDVTFEEANNAININGEWLVSSGFNEFKLLLNN